jgi:hypothetical protein
LAAATQREERPLKIISSQDSARRVESLVPLTAGDPLMFYEKKYQVILDGAIGICKKKPATKEFFDIRTISGPDAEQKLHILSQKNHHENLLYLYEIFAFDGAFYTVSEHTVVSCEHLIGCRRPLEEVHLATISCQVGAI